MPPSSPALREKYDRRQQEVVAIAAALFARRGFQATSMDELSEATGLRSGGLYHYIGSKQRLLFQIFQQLMDPLLEQAADIERSDAAPRPSCANWCARGSSTSSATSTTWPCSPRSATRSSTSPSGSRCARRATASRRSSPACWRPSGSTDRLALFALLGMVNHTATWLKPGGRLTAEQIADGYCDMLLR